MADIGRPPSPSSATFEGGTFAITSKAFDVNSTSDQLTFVYTELKGNATLVARVTGVPNVDPWAQAGLMVRTGTGTGSTHSFVFLTPKNGVATRSRATRGGTTSQKAGGAGTAPVWLKLERRSTTLIASRSSNGSSWTEINSVNVALSTKALVGLAVTSHSRVSNVVAMFDNVTLNGKGFSTTNAAPSISLTSPTPGGATYSSPASIPLSAAATDTDGTIAKVEFYAGATLVATDTSSPYSHNWTGVTVGNYGVRAVATDNAGASTSSDTVTVTVTAPGNVAPLVSMTSPSQGANILLPLTVTLSANASDPDGSIQKVQFYVGSLLVGTDTTKPYSMVWPAILGAHSVSAAATDNKGAVTVSAWRDFTVGTAPVLSRAIFKPASPGDAVDYYLLEVFRAGTNPDVATPVATQNLGLPPVVSGECSAEIRATIEGLATGDYIATVSAVNSGVHLRSNSFAFER